MVYDILIASLPVIGCYFYTYALYKIGLIRKTLHVNFWNFIIGLAFLVSGGAGFLLLILIDMGIVTPITPQLLYGHVEVGITLAIVTVFHFHCYWKSSLEMVFMRKRRTRT